MTPEWVYGRNPVREALQGDLPVLRVLIAQGAHGAAVQEIERLARARKISIQFTDRSSLDRRAGHHQGVLAELRSPDALTLPELLDSLGPPESKQRLLALDSVQDPGNVGALIRTGAATGISGVVIPERRAAGITPAVLKTSAGAALRIPVARVSNLPRALGSLKQAGYWIVGLDVRAAEPFDQGDLRGPLVVVVGAEGKGLGELVRRECDMLVRLPISDVVESLNAAVAGSILLYWLYRRGERSP